MYLSTHTYTHTYKHLWIIPLPVCILLSRSRTRQWARLTLTWTSPTRAERWWSWATRPLTCSPASTRALRTPSPWRPARPRVTAPPSSPSSPPRFQVSSAQLWGLSSSLQAEIFIPKHVNIKASSDLIRESWWNSWLIQPLSEPESESSLLPLYSGVQRKVGGA